MAVMRFPLHVLLTDAARNWADSSAHHHQDSNRDASNTMPEIAEVERARTILEQILKDQTIIDVEAVPHLRLFKLMVHLVR